MYLSACFRVHTFHNYNHLTPIGMIATEVAQFKQSQAQPALSSTVLRGARGSLSGPSRDAFDESEAMDVEDTLEGGAMDVDEELQRLESMAKQT